EVAEPPEGMAPPGQAVPPRVAPTPEADEGLGIFGGVRTTEATDDPPARGAGRRRRPDQEGGPTATGAGPGRVIPIGAAWNQPMASRTVAEQPEEERKPASFRIIRGLLRGPEDDDGHPRVTMRDLPPDIRVHFWRLRLIIAVVVGAVIAALTRSWEIAVTAAILTWIIDTVYRSRNAANYQVAGPHPGARKRTRSQLARMRREGYFTLNDRPIPDSDQIIDHLVIGPTGVYAIDSEKWDHKLPVRTQNGTRLFLGPESQKARLDHASWEAAQASEHLTRALGTQITVRPALAIYGPRIPWEIITIRNVDVFTGTALRRYIRARRKTREGIVRLNRDEVARICEAAERVLPAANQSTNATAPVG
ncbi:MAG TPA: nuclease-related domain-containing protein, partial [Trebonia sp.]|nr:nuclease-related domain-containing protein [Trebonia sp.]